MGSLCVAGLFLVAVGVHKWCTNREVTAAVDSFMTAIVNGDRATVLSLLDTQPRGILESARAQKELLIWRPTPGLAYRVQQIDISGQRAAVRLRIFSDQFSVQPIMRLRRDRAGEWKVGQLEEWSPTRSAERRHRERERREGDRLAKQLADALGTDLHRTVKQ